MQTVAKDLADLTIVKAEILREYKGTDQGYEHDGHLPEEQIDVLLTFRDREGDKLGLYVNSMTGEAGIIANKDSSKALEERLEAGRQHGDEMSLADELAEAHSVPRNEEDLRGYLRGLPARQADLMTDKARMAEKRVDSLSNALNGALGHQAQAILTEKYQEPNYSALVGKDKGGNDVWMTRAKDFKINGLAVTDGRTGETKLALGEEKALEAIKTQVQDRNQELEPERAKARERESQSSGMER